MRNKKSETENMLSSECKIKARYERKENKKYTKRGEKKIIKVRKEDKEMCLLLRGIHKGCSCCCCCRQYLLSRIESGKLGRGKEERKLIDRGLLVCFRIMFSTAVVLSRESDPPLEIPFQLAHSRELGRIQTFDSNSSSSSELMSQTCPDYRAESMSRSSFDPSRREISLKLSREIGL